MGASDHGGWRAVSWMGVAGPGATAILLVIMTGRRWQIAVAVLGGLYIWSATTWTPSNVANAWAGVDLELRENLGRNASLEFYRGLIATVRKLADNGARVVVLPERAIGFWTPTVERCWRGGLADSRVTVIAGAVVDAASAVHDCRRRQWLVDIRHFDHRDPASQHCGLGTALFGKAYRIVIKWYGSEPPDALDDPVYAWKMGYFEGRSVFVEPDPGKLETGTPNTGSMNSVDAEIPTIADRNEAAVNRTDPAKAEPRIDLSRKNGNN